MAIRELIKNINFIAGFLFGFLLTFGRIWFSTLEVTLRPMFDFWSFWPSGVIIEIIPAFISSLFFFLILWSLFLKKSNSLKVSIKNFSFGFLSSYVMFLILTMVAISQFKFTQ